MPEEGSMEKGDLKRNSGIRMNTGGGHGSHPTIRLMRRSTTFSPTEGGPYWMSQSRELEKKICHRIRRKARQQQIGGAPDRDWPIEVDPTTDDDLLLKD
ncbi:unnamed protein product [Strongylus vulgaris]|uniref:Uncharacterized protein n=1 Tax=Strongylus vulgaris TaxID=40348 RepID=A0A3P7JFS6_STRVU|nr:unnamed protein product [Strongylus vulgaris]